MSNPNITISKRQKLVRNSIYGLFSWLLPIIPTLIVTPIVVGRLGNEQYGLYMIVLGFVTYFFTLNIGRTATKYVAEYHGTERSERISDVVSATLILGFAIGVSTVVLIGTFAPLFVTDILLIGPEMVDTAVLALYLGCANILVSMLGLTFQFILQGLQRFDRFLLISNLTSLLLSAGALIVVFTGHGVIGLFVVGLIVSASIGLVSLILVKRLLPELQFRIPRDRQVWRDVVRYGLSIMGYQLFGSLLLLFERAWVARRFGAEAVAFYTIPMGLALYLQMFISSLVLAMFPVVNENLSRVDILAGLYQKSTKIVLMILAFGLVSSVALGGVFLEVWLGSDYADRSYTLLVIHVAAVSIVGLTMIAWQIAEAFHFAPLTAATNFAWMALGIPLMVLLSYYWQTNGVAMGRLAGVLVYIPFIIYIESRFVGGPFSRFWLATLGRIGIAALAVLLLEYLIVRTFEPSWTLLIGTSVAGISLYGVVLFLLGGFDADDRQLLRELVFRKTIQRADV